MKQKLKLGHKGHRWIIIIRISSIHRMKVRPHLFSLSKNLDSLLAAIAGFILIQLFSKHSGIGVSPDSVTYLSAARHLVRGNGFLSFDNIPVIDFPFAYPFFLSAISFFTRLDPLQFGPLLNSFLFGLLLYICGGIMNGFASYSGWYKRILLTCILCSPALQEVYASFWSETIFLPLILLFIVVFSKYVRQMSYAVLLASSGICAVACLTRYAGIFLVPTGIIVILTHPSLVLRKKLIHALLFGGLSLSLILINILHNYQITGLAMGLRPRNNTGLFKIMENFGGVICDWLLVARKPIVEIIFAITVLLVFFIYAISSYRRNKGSIGFEYLLSITGLMYCIFMLFTSTLFRYEQFTNRLLSPLFIPLLWSLTAWFPDYVRDRSYRMQWVTGLSALVLTAWYIKIQLMSDYEFYDGVKDAGVPGYREDPFVQSEIVQFVEKNKTGFDPGFNIYSNAGDAVYFITGLSARQIPFSAFPEKVWSYYDSKNTYLIWFNDLDNPEMPPLDSILRYKQMTLMKQLPDGAVYFSK